MRISELQHDVYVLLDLLKSWGKYVRNPEVLYKLSIDKTSEKSFGYCLGEPDCLVFQDFDIESHAIPHGIEKINKSEIDSQIKLTVLFEEHLAIAGEFDDRVLNLGLNLYVEVRYFEGDILREVFSGFHFDRGGCGKSEFSHPIYHCTHGGEALKPYAADLGKLFVNTGPRILHPPLELILGVDFVIRNYYKKENHLKISTDPRYISIVEKAHSYYWLPYSIAIQNNSITSGFKTNLDFRSVKGY